MDSLVYSSGSLIASTFNVEQISDTCININVILSWLGIIIYFLREITILSFSVIFLNFYVGRGLLLVMLRNTVYTDSQIGRRNHTETSKVRTSAAGTASHIPVRPNIRGSTVRNKSNNANERKKVIRPEKYPFPYAIIRTAA